MISRAQWSSQLVYWILRPWICWAMSLIFWFQCLHPPTPKTLKSGCLLVGNHTGFLDSLIVIAACPKPIVFVMGEGVLKWPWIGPFLPWAGVLILRDGKAQETFAHATKLMAQGQTVCLFPEGRLTPNGQIQRFRKGVIQLQRLSQATLLPFAIHGGFEAWGWGQRLPRRHAIVVQFGQPLPAKMGYAGSTSSVQSQARALQHTVQQLKSQLVQQASHIENLQQCHQTACHSAQLRL